MRSVRFLAQALAAASILTLGACTAEHVAAPPNAISLSWRQVNLPDDPRGRDVVRATAACGGRWYAAGAIVAPDGGTAPALWASSDGRSFTSVPTTPVSAYGPLDVLYSVACSGDDVVAVGAQNGGAHGNPRTSTWFAHAGGSLIEVHAPFEQYGGPNAGFVGQVAGGPGGFLIVGLRIDAHGGAGGAIWRSSTGASFTLNDSDPALESDARGRTELHAGVVTAYGFVAVGGITPPGAVASARDALAWRSVDGRVWQRDALPATPHDDDVMLQVSQVGGELVAVGTDGDAFRVWTGDPHGTAWRVAGSFGGPGDHTTVPTVSSVVGVGSALYAIVSNTSRYAMWRGNSDGQWEQVRLPISVPSAPVAAGPRVVSAAASGQTMMLATDDGRHAALWFTPAG